MGEAWFVRFDLVCLFLLQRYCMSHFMALNVALHLEGGQKYSAACMMGGCEDLTRERLLCRLAVDLSTL